MEKLKELQNLYEKIEKEYDENQKEYLKLLDYCTLKETEKSVVNYLNSMHELKKQLKIELYNRNIWCLLAPPELLKGDTDEN